MKYTTEQLWAEWEKNPESVYRLVVTGQLWVSHLFEDVDKFTKSSISRKAFRYVAEQATKGTIPATLIAIKLGFHKMDCGEPVPIGCKDNSGWISPQTFTDKRGNLIHVDLNPVWEITFKSLKGSKTVERPLGCHVDYIHTCIDIPQMYNDERYGWEIEDK